MFVLWAGVTHAKADVARRACALALALGLICGTGPALARRGSQLKTIRYHGYAARVPSSWPVYDLGRDPRRCVRFDQHALYLGVPGSQESCPAHAAGNRGGMLLEPVGSHVRVIRTATQTRPRAGPVSRGARAHAARPRTREDGPKR